jgi:hypothetical protein
MFRTILIFLLLSIAPNLFAQQGIIKGVVTDLSNNKPLSFATIVLQGQEVGAYTDDNGTYTITLPIGLYNITCSNVGYISKTINEVEVKQSKPANINISLEPATRELQNVVIEASKFSFDKNTESPVSLRTIGVNEIQRNPGGNRDISRVLQSLPGVQTITTFRNDILIRGGGPNENRFYIDGIEVPNINHFATQGSSGGPVGLLNVDLIKDVKFYSSAFPANRGNALSSVMELTSIDGRNDRLGFITTVGSSDLALSVQTPLFKKGSKNTALFSVRRSYLQLLFQTLGLPFLPTYNDYQFRFKLKPSANSELTIMSLGAYDVSNLNLSADSTAFQKYLLGNLPEYFQWNYTFGLSYKYFGKNNFVTVVASRNMLNNTAQKYFNNDKSDESNKIFDYTSQEIENKLRIENNIFRNGWKINYGALFENVKYKNSTLQTISLPQGTIQENFNSFIEFNKGAVFTQFTRNFLKDRLISSFGLRTDVNSYSSSMLNPLSQLSPRLSFSYILTERISINANTGIYYQLPPYTVLGYRTNENVLINKQNNIQYIRSIHYVAGIEYYSKTNTRLSIEGFYKDYSNYPFILTDSIALANLGADFGVVGNAPANSGAKGKSYGIEFLLQQKLYKGFYGILSVTAFRSFFTNADGDFISSSWDTRIISSLTAGKRFKKNWEVGFRWRLSGGSPFTPIDIVRSSQVAIWNIYGRGLADFSQLNTQRLPLFHQLDVRVDKKIPFKSFILELYIDVQNAYAFKYSQQPYLDVRRDADGNPLIDTNTPLPSYQTYLLENISGTVLPTLGIIIEY